MAPDTAPLPPLRRPLTDDPERSHTLSAPYYIDPEIYEREKEVIFAKSWQYVGHLCHFEKPGNYVTVTIADQGVFVIRGKDGKLRGFYNVCQHRAHELLQGEGSVKGAITCPYHAWGYDLEGNLRAARNCDGLPDFDKADFTLPQVQVEVFCGFVFVNLDDQAPSLASQAGDLAEDIARRIPFLDQIRPLEPLTFGQGHIAAGWKVVVDNYVECYHCGPAHPDFADMISMEAYQTDTFGLWSRQLGPEVKTENSAYDFKADYGLQRAAFWYLWPNTTFNTLPGTNTFSVLTIRPIDHQTSAFMGHVFTPDGTYLPASREYINNVLGPEDQRLCESVQRGLKSKGYIQGRIVTDAKRSGISEHAIHQFHRRVQLALAG